MPSTADPTAHRAGTGIVRRFWWRTGQPTRLAIGCLGVLTALVTTGAVGFSGGEHPRERGSAGLEEAEHRGDALQVTVRTVSDVDLFEGAEPVTGRIVRARVAGLRAMRDCWAAESLATAQNLLRGKNVRLVVRRDHASGGDRMPVDVELPGGADYARTVVGEGVVPADLSARGELASVESTARLERRGLWATDCAPSEVKAISSVPSPSAPSPATTTTTTTTAPATTESSVEPQPSSSPTTTSSPPPDEEWDDGRLGKLCLFEGARRTTEDGNEMVCSRNGKNQLRWRRAD